MEWKTRSRKSRTMPRPLQTFNTSLYQRQPPSLAENCDRRPKGCQTIASCHPSETQFHFPLQPVVALRLPPANFLKPFGLKHPKKKAKANQDFILAGFQKIAQPFETSPTCELMTESAILRPTRAVGAVVFSNFCLASRHYSHPSI